jgi:protein ImuB
MFGCLYIPDFLVQAESCLDAAREAFKKSPVVILDGPLALMRVVASNPAARRAGIEIGMTKLQIETAGGVTMRKRSTQNERKAQIALMDCAATFSPRVESTAPGTVILDLHGSERLFGNCKQISRTISLRASEFGFDANIALASNPDTALHAARGFAGITVISPGREAQEMASLPLTVLTVSPEILDTLESWGIRNFGALAALPPIALAERLGQEGLRLQRLALGDTQRTIVAVEVPANFIETFEFEEPVETLESLTFILNRLLLQICMRLNSHSLAAIELSLQLELEARQLQTGSQKELFNRVWKMPLPIADAKVLLRLICLDLEGTSFSAPIKKLRLEALPSQLRPAQAGLFTPASPQAEQLEITLARIRGVVGSADRDGIACVGYPQLLDSHKPDSFAVIPLSAAPGTGERCDPQIAIALRMFRPPLETIVEFGSEKPDSVILGKRRCHVLTASGPWRNSGEWWNAPSRWSHEEWDVALKTPEGCGVYRIYRDDHTRKWFVEGVFD